MSERELIIVEMKDGTVCRMAKKAVDMLLRHNRIARFRRSGDWIEVDKAPLREAAESSSFSGYDRRSTI